MDAADRHHPHHTPDPEPHEEMRHQRPEPSRWFEAIPVWLPVLVVVVGAVANATVNWMTFGNGIANNAAAIAQEKADRVAQNADLRDQLIKTQIAVEKVSASLSNFHDDLVVIGNDVKWIRQKGTP